MFFGISRHLSIVEPTIHPTSSTPYQLALCRPPPPFFSSSPIPSPQISLSWAPPNKLLPQLPKHYKPIKTPQNSLLHPSLSDPTKFLKNLYVNPPFLEKACPDIVFLRPTSRAWKTPSSLFCMILHSRVLIKEGIGGCCVFPSFDILLCMVLHTYLVRCLEMRGGLGRCLRGDFPFC